MLEAVVLAADDRLCLHVLGAFSDDSRAAFDRRVSTLGLTKRIVIEGWLPFEEAFSRLLDADIGLILFQPGFENHVFASPHKLYDYMLAGLPVIAPIFAVEVSDVIRRYDCGLLVDPSDPADIAVALARLTTDPKLRRQMGCRGQTAVLEELNWERESLHLLDLYRRIGIPTEDPSPR
jgi:glycosyltransferase involved in cell wall biosynthesis